MLRRWLIAFAVLFVFLELVARQFIAGPNRIVRRSPDPEMVYETAPGTWLGHAKYDVWTAPIYMIWDVVNAGPVALEKPPPLGYTIYRIDEDGCRITASAPERSDADVVVLGSSQSFGLFVPAEDTVAVMLENQLRAHQLLHLPPSRHAQGALEEPGAADARGGGGQARQVHTEHRARRGARHVLSTRRR